MIRRTRILDRETWTRIGVAVIAAPVVISYGLWLWTLLRLLADVGSAALAGLASLAS